MENLKARNESLLNRLIKELEINFTLQRMLEFNNFCLHVELVDEKKLSFQEMVLNDDFSNLKRIRLLGNTVENKKNRRLTLSTCNKSWFKMESAYEINEKYNKMCLFLSLIRQLKTFMEIEVFEENIQMNLKALNMNF